MKTKTPITDSSRGFHDLDTAVPASEMEKLELRNVQLIAMLSRCLSIIEDIPHPGNYAAIEIRKLIAE